MIIQGEEERFYRSSSVNTQGEEKDRKEKKAQTNQLLLFIYLFLFLKQGSLCAINSA